MTKETHFVKEGKKLLGEAAVNTGSKQEEEPVFIRALLFI